MKKALVAGTFDIIHPGHIFLLKQAKKQGDILIVVIARDKAVKKLKKRRPIFNEKQRLLNLKRLKIADKVLLGNHGNKLKIISQIKPDVICLGYDQKIKIFSLAKSLKKMGLAPKIIRIKSFFPKRYKSSKLRPS